MFLAADLVLGEGLNGVWGCWLVAALVFLPVDKSFTGFFGGVLLVEMEGLIVTGLEEYSLILLELMVT